MPFLLLFRILNIRRKIGRALLMNKAKALMRQAHAHKTLQESTIQSQGVKYMPESPRPPAPPAQPKVEIPVRKEPEGKQVLKEKNYPTAVLQIAREDVPVTNYGIKPVPTNFNCYNKEIFTWLKNFSSNNQFSGGVPITKSQVMEIALDVLFYDLGINPIGYESQQALREDIQHKLNGH